MQDTLQSIIAQAKKDASSVESRADFENFKSKIVGPKGALTQTMKGIGKLAPEDRPKAGKWINESKRALDSIFAPLLETIEKAELQKQIGPAIDPTLPSLEKQGSIHPLTRVRQEMCDILKTIGFSVAEGPEIDTEWFCFDALNTPDHHPARDAQDTLYLPTGASVEGITQKDKERHILRTHTSTVQIRAMLQEKPPLRIIAPGRSFRRDTTDATHSANFHQLEGLYVDENVSIKDLKATLDYFIQSLFGKNVETRLRPSFFPFTEPSFEMDMRLPNFGKLSGKWIEIMGCGMVDPKVFDAVDYDTTKWSGFAWGIGIERVAMLLYGVDDIRLFYQNDVRFLKQFA